MIAKVMEVRSAEVGECVVVCRCLQEIGTSGDLAAFICGSQ